MAVRRKKRSCCPRCGRSYRGVGKAHVLCELSELVPEPPEVPEFPFEEELATCCVVCGRKIAKIMSLPITKFDKKHVKKGLNTN